MVVDELDALRSKFDGCETIAFADLSTQMILVTDSGSDLRREALDALCSEATLTLGATGTPAIGTQISTVSIVAGKAVLRLFVRATQEPNEVLCCICTPKVDVGAFLADARSCLNRISGSA